MSRGRTTVTVGRLRVECERSSYQSISNTQGGPSPFPGFHSSKAPKGPPGMEGAGSPVPLQGWVLMISADSHGSVAAVTCVAAGVGGGMQTHGRIAQPHRVRSHGHGAWTYLGD